MADVTIDRQLRELEVSLRDRCAVTGGSALVIVLMSNGFSRRSAIGRCGIVAVHEGIPDMTAVARFHAQIRRHKKREPVCHAERANSFPGSASPEIENPNE
jgi:hypothetical protein